MSYRYYNPNPNSKSIGDCVIRAISKVLDQSWDKTYIELCVQGYLMKDLPDSNVVWDSYLRGCGFIRRVIPNTCPDCYSVSNFCDDYPKGNYVVATNTHVIAIKDGDIWDSWDSSNEIPIYYWSKKN